MKRKILHLLTALLLLCGVSIAAHADVVGDFSLPQAETFEFKVDTLKLVAQQEPPIYAYTPSVLYDTETEPVVKDHAPWEKENWTWMRTNPGVKEYKFLDDVTFVGIPIFAAGLIAKGEKHAFRQKMRHALVTDFRTGVDDYLQYFGPAMTVGLKVAGLEGRSDWGRFLASSAMSAGLMALFVNTLKYSTKEMRPDGSTANSWPSGHTATAFVGATILHKEYGLTRSPWYSVAGYGVATATGVMRVLNNRHWVSDVLSGAGIGVLSGELGYALSDLIFKGKGLLRGNISSERSIIDHPSFFSISMGIGFGSRNMDFDMQKFNFDDGDGDRNFNLKFGMSTAVSAEGAYFLNKYLGVGVRVRVNASPVQGWGGIENYAWSDVVNSYIDIAGDEGTAPIINGRGTPGKEGYQYPYSENVAFAIESDHLTEFSADIGVYLNLPISKRFALGTKALIGRSVMQEIDLNATATGGIWDFNIQQESLAKWRYTDVHYLGEYDTTWDYFTVSGNNTVKFGSGVSFTYAYKDNFSWRIFLDYDFSRKTYTMEYNPAGILLAAFPLYGRLFSEDEFKETQSITQGRHTFILGGSFVVSF